MNWHNLRIKRKTTITILKANIESKTNVWILSETNWKDYTWDDLDTAMKWKPEGRNQISVNSSIK